MRALIASGSGRYGDPWHPFAHTSPLIAEILQVEDFRVDIDDDVDHAMTRLDGVDLLVVNAGDSWRDADPAAVPDGDSLRGLNDALERGIGVVAVHCAVSSLRDYPSWHPAIAGMWVPSLSHHPPADETTIRELDIDGSGTRSFRVFDERYCRIQRLGEITVVAEHCGANGPEPTAWIREFGTSRVAVDLLGHDERSYESAGRRALLARLARWAAGIDGPTVAAPSRR